MPKNMNELAKKLCEMEKGKKEMTIAQVKELLRCLVVLIKKDPIGMISLLTKQAKK